MSKGKFASLIILGAFSAGIASSSAVSAQGNESLASVTDVNGIGTHDDSVSVVSKVSSEPAIADDETKIDTEVTTELILKLQQTKRYKLLAQKIK